MVKVGGILNFSYKICDEFIFSRICIFLSRAILPLIRHSISLQSKYLLSLKQLTFSSFYMKRESSKLFILVEHPLLSFSLIVFLNTASPFQKKAQGVCFRLDRKRDFNTKHVRLLLQTYHGLLLLAFVNELLYATQTSLNDGIVNSIYVFLASFIKAMNKFRNDEKLNDFGKIEKNKDINLASGGLECIEF